MKTSSAASAHMSDHLRELKTILRKVGPENIWRPVYGPNQRLLARGVGEEKDGLPRSMPSVDLIGKSVVDLGCNFGYYTFWARRAGARRVLGLDRDERIIRGCELLKSLHQIDGVDFLTLDLLNPHDLASFDVAMMIDLIGKTFITSGLLQTFLGALESLSDKELLLTVRPRYHVNKNLGGDVKSLAATYPGNYIRGNYFYPIEVITDRFAGRWDVQRIEAENDPEDAAKQTLHFIRKKREEPIP